MARLNQNQETEGWRSFKPVTLLRRSRFLKRLHHLAQLPDNCSSLNFCGETVAYGRWAFTGQLFPGAVDYFGVAGLAVD